MILDILSIVSIGLLVGAEFTVSAFINPILGQLEPAENAHVTSLFARKLGFVMPFWYGLSFLLLVAEVVVHRHTGTAFLATASAIWGCAILFSVLVLVPINNRIIAMTPDGYSDQLKQQHTRWDMLHRWRVLALGAAMVGLLIGVGV